MKIALCHPFFRPKKGGCETYIRDLAHRLAADSHEVTLIGWEHDPLALPPEAQFHQLPRPRFLKRFNRPWLYNRACNAVLQCSDFDVSIGFDKTIGQDILYPQGGLHLATADHNILAASPGWKRRKAWLGQRLDPAYWSFCCLEQKQYFSQRQPIVIVNSQWSRSHFAKYYGREPQDIRIVPSAIQPDRVHANLPADYRAQCRQMWKLDQNAPVGLLAATNGYLKGAEPLLRAIALLPQDRQFAFLFVGLSDSSPYKAIAKSLGIESRVRFAGHCTNMKEIYASVDFLVHPTFYDPCSLVALEASICNLPVLTSRHNGAVERLPRSPGTMVISDPHDVHALSVMLEEMLDPVGRARQMAGESHITSSLFEEHYQSILAIFEEVCARRTSRCSARYAHSA